MTKLKQIPFEKESPEIKNKVVTYWSKRAESFSEHKHQEIHSKKKQLWQAEFLRHFSVDDKLSVLDVGCGAGFFEMVLSDFDLDVTGVDLTPEMIERGKELLSRHGSKALLKVMDAENLDFPDSSFDLVINRNLVWTLPHPVEAYREWHRVLKPGGMLLVYDAEYAKGFHHYDQMQNLAHKNVTDAMTEECHDIYHMLSISALDRPEWDKAVLEEIGFEDVMTDPDVGDRLYGEKDQFYMPDRMFLVKARKA
ncbi:MAG: methyltransferase domain-containing protein [Butyrivibrio sp.]|uniref:class I SAM-dependent methyltransferase n=1 Tax=Butyrivibrio sp. TaxID=28121 RepID=UPI001B4FE168|nr:class I SAM-dependent methyltransferase [Butyrivibrio sp.]MBP3781887.1 methyltransferase domain-containing protein [Butyrivibrio sp.]MBP3814031.1 methyltransferase domain-containing protein [Butyrivibrio sp.]